MGTSISTPSPQSAANVLSQYEQYLPGIIQSISAQQPILAENQLQSTMATQPLYNALNLQQAQQYALPLAQVGQQVTNANALAGAQTNLQQLQGAGGQAANAALGLAQQTNPYYYQAIGPAAAQSANLLNSINLQGLSPGEQNAVERSLNQSNYATGNLGIDNATNAVSNAMNYGGAFNQKLGILGSALGAANQTANTAQNTGFSPINIALGQPNTSTMANFGTGTFSPTTASTQNASASNALSGANSLLGGMTSMNNSFTGASAQNYGNMLGLVGQGVGTAGGLGAMAAGGGCCFIVMECYHGTMPPYVRKCRDRYYRSYPRIATGYKRMASVLVPLMQRSNIIRAFVWNVMVKPLTDYGAFVTRKSSDRKGRWARKFWFTVWNKLGE